MFIVIELQKSAESVVSNIVNSYDTQAEAESKYYSVLSAAAISNVPCHSAVLVSEEGFPLMHQCYKHG